MTNLSVAPRAKPRIYIEKIGDRERAILLARIHVRGSGVRSWGRYVEAKFIHDVVVGRNGPPLMNITQMAQFMEKSVSWVQRLRDAYAFAQAFTDHIDDDGDAECKADPVPADLVVDGARGVPQLVEHSPPRSG